MSRRDNSELRCGRCRLHERLCLCPELPQLQTRTRLALVIHRYEARKPTNSGLLATHCLPNSEVHVRGHLDEPAPRFVADPETQPLLLFPREDARPIGDFAGSARPVTLVVPDGTWRQASKVAQRMPGLEDVPCVTLPPMERSRYILRAEVHAGRLATLEAIARAFGILEGAAVQRALEAMFRRWVDRSLWMRGNLPTSQVTGGIPEAALLHDPRGGRPPRV